MTDVLIPFGGEFLALTHQEFEQARLRGREIVPQASATASPSPDQILDAEGMEQVTGVPASWFLEQARRGKVPHLRAGKYVRFRLSELLDVLKASSRHADKPSPASKNRTAFQCVAGGRYQSATAKETRQ